MFSSFDLLFLIRFIATFLNVFDIVVTYMDRRLWVESAIFLSFIIGSNESGHKITTHHNTVALTVRAAVDTLSCEVMVC